MGVPGGTQFPSPRPQHRPPADGARRAARRAARRDRIAAAGTVGVAGELANALRGLDALRNGALVEVGFAKTWEPKVVGGTYHNNMGLWIRECSLNLRL